MNLGTTVTFNDTLHVEKPQVKYLQGDGVVLQAQTTERADIEHFTGMFTAAG